MKPGDIVRLKSGGPKMTVMDVPSGPGPLQIYWFTPPGDLHTGYCHESALNVVESAQSVSLIDHNLLRGYATGIVKDAMRRIEQWADDNARRNHPLQAERQRAYASYLFGKLRDLEQIGLVPEPPK